ncbi:MAG: hypothetical protein ISP49_12860 [Reyranella sp.]|jgi:hypothetical protein|nr:hypothetical protein [Reyranella sp.]MBL6652480.1 hypothetical protein [Reyranella sp.]
MPRPGTALSTSEEITLRRVAHGQSDIGRLPAEDLARLRWLMLVDGQAGRPKLTSEGRRRFEELAKPIPFSTFDAEGTLSSLVKRLQARTRK